MGDETTSNFSSSENFVVLECVDRLLSKGYPAASLTLEKKWSLGRDHKGKLDILVSEPSGQSYLMIECKTWGNEFTKEKKKMFKDGGQLFSYFKQDTHAQYLCLYTSCLSSSKIDYQSDIIKIEEEFRQLGTVEEMVDRWNKEFNSFGVFEEGVNPYNVQLKALTRKELKELKQEDSGRIYNQFLEIIRHNVVSDKANAFNKIFNLFLCKVLDEDRNADDELFFQWIEGKDTFESLLDRLNKLYKEGMKEYLNKEITDYSDDDLKNYQSDSKVYDMLKELRLYKNQEFAFTEVFNEESFKENAQIVKEVVQLLQRYQIRYTHKQQFLGDFFELLLNTGFKQESGQFFTPVPLVRFLLESLPLKELMLNKIKNKDNNFIPYTIDFACGSGHFLTEAMDVIQKHLNQLDASSLSPSQQKKLAHHKGGDYEWAKEFMYGIERDYRLVKTTKLSCFLHGDGEAQIIHASGLEPFNQGSYINKLATKKGQDNEEFDLLIANPPYSVAGFKSVMQNTEEQEAFSLFNSITDKSGHIEVLFIERMKQLVKPLGYAVIILPDSLLTNDGDYEKARKMMLEHFHLKTVVQLGSGAFAATGTKTATLFLQKRPKPVVLNTREDYVAMSQDALLWVNSGDNKAVLQEFLGYKFSNRRGQEGMHLVGEGKLFDKGNPHNPAKANSYIFKAMLDEPVGDIADELKEHITLTTLDACLDFEAEKFSNSLKLRKKKALLISNYPLMPLSAEVVSITKGKAITKAQVGQGKIPVIAGGKSPAYYHNQHNYEGEVTTISASGQAGYVSYHHTPIWASDCLVLQTTPVMHPKYLFFCLKTMQGEIYKLQQGIAQPHVYAKNIEKLSVPLPATEKQEGIVMLMQQQETIIEQAKATIKEAKKAMASVDFSSYPLVGLSDLTKFKLIIGKRLVRVNLTQKKEGSIPAFSANVFKPFGYTNKHLKGFTDFSISSVLWGIDGDWMVNYLPPNMEFFPTDHCGVLRTVDSTIDLRYAKVAIETAGIQAGFCRTYRASLDNMMKLRIPLPFSEKQKELGDLLEHQENIITQAELEIQEAQADQERIMATVFTLTQG